MDGVKIAAFDFDGTILFDGGIAEDTLDAIHGFQEAGNLAVAATGRSLATARFATTRFGLDFDYLVLNTGAVLADRDDTVLAKRFLDFSLVEDVVDTLSRHEGIALYGTTLTGRDSCFYHGVGFTKSGIVPDFQQANVHEMAGENFIGIPIWVPRDRPKLRAIIDEITATWDVEYTTNQDFIDIIPTGSTKGNGLLGLIDHLGMRRENVKLVTFGDSWNDLSMHAIADRSFSFPWSPADVRAQTSFVTESVVAGLSLIDG
ncbi:HAD family hydrolase [Corynebacterium vitaeruminis]|uniref:HAD family hydrolase n=1 Tax=Corynebacterium vitaeruminis TaxID=38305 RepID=UPI0023F9FC7F|nr:HAD family hydrolase [Corynebacterium vitaeruminis]